MNIENILNIVYALAAFLTAAIPLAIALIANIKRKIFIAKQLAVSKDETERAQLNASQAVATTEMNDICATLISNAEVLYKDVANLLKKEGKSAGAVKKDSVMSKLQAYALENGYTFDATYWNEKIDEIVALTKHVNV